MALLGRIEKIRAGTIGLAPVAREAPLIDIKNQSIELADSHVKSIDDIWSEHIQVASAMHTITGEIAAAVEMIWNSLDRGGKLLIAGNGGSAGDAQHIAAELTGRFMRSGAPCRPWRCTETSLR